MFYNQGYQAETNISNSKKLNELEKKIKKTKIKKIKNKNKKKKNLILS